MRTARSISEVLAWRLGHHLITRPEPLLSSAITSRTPDPETWRLLAWTLKAAETNGTPAETIISNARRARSLGDLLMTAQAAALTPSLKAADAPGLPPWLTSTRHQAPAPADVPDGGLTRYLDDAEALITTRIRDLTDAAERDRPAWMNLLGQPPPDDTQREQWHYHIGIIAAYRDQHQITSDDPRQVLGPYHEPGHAGHAAYWHTVQSVVTARQLAGLRPTADSSQPDPIRGQIATDIYLSLPEPDRAAACSALAERLGSLWLGNQHQTDNHAATHPAYAADLAAALTAQGYLTGLVTHPSLKVFPAQPQPVEETFAHRQTARPSPRHPAPARPVTPGEHARHQHPKPDLTPACSPFRRQPADPQHTSSPRL